MFNYIKKLIKRTSLWRSYKQYEIHKVYLRHSRRYRELNKKSCLKFDKDSVTRTVRERILSRGYTPVKKKIGEVHTFSVIRDISWHSVLYNDLRTLGPHTNFDIQKFFPVNRSKNKFIQTSKAVNEKLLSRILEVHKENPIDWVFCYAGIRLLPQTIREIQNRLGIPVVNMCLDDKQWLCGWNRSFMGSPAWWSPRALIKEFDLWWTSAGVCREWIAVEGGRPLYMPEGCDPDVFRPLSTPRDIMVSFVGHADGFRRDFIEFLRRWHVPVQTFGRGWTVSPGLSLSEMIEVFNRSSINLGHGGIDYSETLTNVKGRDFEVPATGGGMYMTTYNPDLAKHFAVGSEIICYRSREELVDLIHYWLTHGDDLREMAVKARTRCVSEHRWLHRYVSLLKVLNIVDDNAIIPELPRLRKN